MSYRRTGTPAVARCKLKSIYYACWWKICIFKFLHNQYCVKETKLHFLHTRWRIFVIEKSFCPQTMWFVHVSGKIIAVHYRQYNVLFVHKTIHLIWSFEVLRVNYTIFIFFEGYRSIWNSIIFSLWFFEKNPYGHQCQSCKFLLRRRSTCKFYTIDDLDDYRRKHGCFHTFYTIFLKYFHVFQ